MLALTSPANSNENLESELSWDHNPETVQALRTWCWRQRPDFVFIMKSMLDSSKLELVRNKCGFQNGVCVSN